MSRPRRATLKAVNYAKEQEFSDAEDLFEEKSEEEEVVVPPKRSRGRPRKSIDNNHDATVEEPEDYGLAEPAYVEKGYDPSLPPLRERFNFMPEYELDGSPGIDLIVGRRPMDDKHAEASEDDDNNASAQDSDDSADGKRGTRSSKKEKSPRKKDSPLKSNLHQNEHVEYEYLVKYKGRSYLHLDWKTGADLESMNKQAKTLYRRFLKKLALGLDDELEDPNFDPAFCQPQKIVDVQEQEITLELTDHELVDWEKERKKALAEEEAAAKADEMSIEGVEENSDEEAGRKAEEIKVEGAKEDVGSSGKWVARFRIFHAALKENH